MKSKIFILLTLAVTLCLPPRAFASEHNFPAGSLIIPMDSHYQSDGDGGILETYGLVFYLLDHKDNQGEHDITVYWIINEEKADIDGIDLLIEVANADILGELGTDAVAKLYTHAGGTADLAYRSGDSDLKISYLGAPFVVDEVDVVAAQEIISQSQWSAVEVHQAQVPFKAEVSREMHGTPPKIALMNNKEDKTGGGNAAILESYLRLAGICEDVYDIVTPLEIRDGILQTEGYDFLWAPHWTGYGDYADDVEAIVTKVKEFLEDGKGLFAECASIEVFEHSDNGRFLTDKSFGHNGGTNDSGTIIYNDKASPFSQVGDFSYDPEGGHLHNWRPFVFGDPYGFSDPPDEVPAGAPRVTAGNPSVYNDTVTRFTIDNTGWDYYVGGYAYGDNNNGYVVYLGGHKYAKCKGAIKADPEANVHTLEIEFKKDMSDEAFTLLAKYASGSSSTTVTFTKDDLTAVAGDPLEVDMTTASADKKKIKEVTFRNKGEGSVDVDSLTLSWSGGHADQKVKKITDKKIDEKYYDDKDGAPSGTEFSTADFTIATAGGGAASCTNNDDCSWKNIAGVRYVLNTLFNIKFQIQSKEYARAAPVVRHPYLYQGSFEYPSFSGHFRRYDVTLSAGAKYEEWDTADRILNANAGNADGRKVYTAKQNGDGTWSKINFDAANINELRAALAVTPGNGDDTDEIAVINRLRGKEWQGGAWAERTNKLGGIVHSAPAIVESNSRFPGRDEIAYVGDLYGMLHAIEIDTGDEKWAFIPPNLLGKLKNDRTDPYATQDFAAVDASPMAKDIFYDHDNNSGTPKAFRTILVCPEGPGGNSVFALDISDPDNWSVLWEVTETDANSPGGGMGSAYRVASNRVKFPVKDAEDKIIGYEAKWVLFAATGYASTAGGYGGLNVFAFDLITGAKLWNFSQEYADSVNDIPGAVTLFDIDHDNFIDRAYIGDMNGRFWEINAVDGTNPHGTDDNNKQIPLWNCGVGKPISVSPAVTLLNGHVILFFGTGGTDWAADNQSYAIYTIDATNLQGNKSYVTGAGTLLWKIDLDVGEKVWSSPTIAAGELYLATGFGKMESSDPRQDIPSMGQKSGDLYSVSLEDGSISWTIANIGKVRGSVYIDRQHVYSTTIDNKILQFGGESFSQGSSNNVRLNTWRHLY